MIKLLRVTNMFIILIVVVLLMNTYVKIKLYTLNM